ncbi:threonine/homoserine/homoserine lactone efflux protein [Jatrophihabitans sp. GAS493]|uniref:LysE family translocator n=1 Tax=Jatrophihabitans sp. GAS493 TaxID=1907575 RepID=UPI000BC0BCD3|nr:LysE family translocator [Jatrophihabitans sp. GAS493]SOD72663.1 threonine/homoserine/homoserine lactone efflux protein [Jatrophihabitans sp. GAS493]
MPTTSVLLSFLGATVLLILLPGPNMFFLLARGIGSGRQAAVVSAFGIEAATTVFVVATAFGFSAVLASSAIAFSVIRYAGAAYLIYLGLRTILGGGEIERQLDSTPASARRSAREAFLVGITNPKVALFFVAFFPQFLDPARGPVAAQTFLLGAIFVVVGLSFDLVFAFSSGSIGRLLQRRPAILRRQRYVSGLAYLGLGAFAAATGQRHH